MSHRLVRGTAPRDPSGWRLPAAASEDKVSDMIRPHLNQPEARAGILVGATTDETVTVDERLP